MVEFQTRDGDIRRGKVVSSYSEQTGEKLYVIESQTKQEPIYLAICTRDIFGRYVEYKL